MEVVIKGYLRAVVVDRFAEKTTEVQYFLEDDSSRIQLAFKKPPSFTEIGEKIKVRGK